MAKASEILTAKFPFEPTPGQLRLFMLFDDFLKQKADVKATILLKGYAGTGKTTVVSAIVEVLPFFKYKFLLLAPTGRAAKVMASYSGKNAYTIHKKIYKQTADPRSGLLVFQKQKNYYKNTIFIVDEASMLSDQAEFGDRGLLADLLQFVFENDSNKLMLIGDAAQLPPVGQVKSPGLDAQILQKDFGLHVFEAELTEVMRQGQASGILFNATQIRAGLQKKEVEIRFTTANFPDIYRMTAEKMEDGLRYAYDKFGVENTIIVCRSNKSAVQYNEYIRRTILYQEGEIEAGDYLMIVRNNYFFLGEDAPGGFLANGDFVEVMKVVRFEELFGFRFATLMLRLTDYPEQEKFEATVMLDTLHSPAASLSGDDYRKLYEQVLLEYADCKTRKERNEMIRKDPYLNALQIKFAYALTCHKSQGGQWQAVFVDQGYLKQEMIDKEYMRWLYTAITRASQELFLVNFSANFF